MASIPVKPLGFKSGEGYDAVQGPDGRRYYMTNGMLLDPQTGAQVGNAAPANTMVGGAPGGAMGMTPGTPGAGYWRDPGTAVNAIQPYIDAVRAGIQGPGGLEPRIQGGPYLRREPAMGYPQMPGYPGERSVPSPYGPGDPNRYWMDEAGNVAGTQMGWRGQPGAGGMGYPQAPGYPGGDPFAGGVYRKQPYYYGGGDSRMPRDPGGMSDMMGRFEGNLKQQGGPAMRYGQQPAQPQQKPAVQPYQRPTVPLAHQVNPMVWDSLGPVGRELAYGAIGATGQDPTQYEYDLNQARPRGASLGGGNVRYASSRGFGGF